MWIQAFPLPIGTDDNHLFVTRFQVYIHGSMHLHVRRHVAHEAINGLVSMKNAQIFGPPATVGRSAKK